MGWRQLHRSATTNTSVGDAVDGWPNALVVRIGTEHPNYIINHEKLRVSANRPAGSNDTNTDPSTSQWKGQERGAEKTEEKVGSFPREESLLLRWTDHSGPTEWGLAPHPGPYSRHKWIILYIWVSSRVIFGLRLCLITCEFSRCRSDKGIKDVHLCFHNRTAITGKPALYIDILLKWLLSGILDLRRTLKPVLVINKNTLFVFYREYLFSNTQLILKPPDFIM